MPGEIKAGRGTLIGNAGEYYVVAELLKRGVVADLAPRNAPAFDVLAIRGPKSVRIRVKTKSAGYDVWQWMAKAGGVVFRDIAPDDFTVLVSLAEHRGDMEFFVVPTHELDAWIEHDFQVWVATPGKNGRPHSPTNAKRTFSRTVCASRIDKYLEGWDGLWK